MKCEIWFDGASRGNPGKASYGFLIKGPLNKQQVESYGLLSNNGTNNEAEYTACIESLETAKALGYTEAKVYSDSKLVVEQMKGNWKIKSKNLKDLNKKAKEAEAELESVEFQHIPREENSEADALANLAFNS